MSRKDKRIALSFLACLFVGVLAWLLFPSRPNLRTDSDYQSNTGSYEAYHPECNHKALSTTPQHMRESAADRCGEAAEQHRETVNSLINAKRQADAADAGIVLAYKQTQIAALGLVVGFVTLIAAGLAVWFARQAADIATAEFVAANAPRLKVTQINIDIDQWVRCGQPSSAAEVYVFNDGRNDATLLNDERSFASAVFYVGRHPPSGRPFDLGDKHIRDNELILKDGKLAVGDGHWWQLCNFESVTIEQVKSALSTEAADRMFLIGRLHYLDTRNSSVSTVFCRVFDKETQRWMLAGYPEYEY